MPGFGKGMLFEHMGVEVRFRVWVCGFGKCAMRGASLKLGACDKDITFCHMGGLMAC